ncbi:MAG: PHP domain-containing protein [Clostridia bacterium]|nr:PHP domain-containing protein [Clostridia bacterium]
MKKYLLPQVGQFYKANLHCHSTVSDGRWTPEQIKEAYMEKGYSIVAYTDHDVMIPHHELTDESFLAMTGYEMEVHSGSVFKYRKTCHMCLVALRPDIEKQVCWHREKYMVGNGAQHRDQVRFEEDLPDFERNYDHACICEMMRIGRESGFFVTYNHPTWSLEDYRNYGGYENMHAMEIFNNNSFAAGHAEYNPHVYDDLLRQGKRIYCIATDDNHDAHPIGSRRNDSFGGFTMIKADKLDYTTIGEALLAGNFYASQGPAIEELWYEDGKLYVKSSAADRITMTTGTRKVRTVYREKGKMLTKATFEVQPDDIYVRVTVTDKYGKHADTNAYFVDELFGE